jgi:hypothetical protein
MKIWKMDPPSAFKQAILDDFSIASKANDMWTDTLLVGQLDIGGFVANVIDELLNILPVEHPSYAELMRLLGDFLRELARKKRNRNRERVCIGWPWKVLQLPVIHNLSGFLTTAFRRVAFFKTCR